MTYRIAINGFGLIGRNYLRRLTGKTLANAGLQVVAINDLYDVATLAHLLEYDSTFGRLDAEVSYGGGRLIVGRHDIPTFAERRPDGYDNEWGYTNRLVDLTRQMAGR